MNEATEKYIRDFDPTKIPGNLSSELAAKGLDNGNPGTCHLLNYCASQIDPEESCYLEVGVFEGRTLISAAWNHDAPCVGVDIAPQPKAYSSLAKAGLPNAKLIKDDFRRMHLWQNVNGRQAKVYLYDGAHDFRSQWDGLLNVKHLLEDEAIVFVDDVNPYYFQNLGPYFATTWVAENDPEYELIRLFPASDQIHSGLAVLKFTRKSQ